jgi:hypothetical protein
MFPAKADTGQMTARHTTANAFMIFSQCSIRTFASAFAIKGPGNSIGLDPRKHSGQTQEFSTPQVESRGVQDCVAASYRLPGCAPPPRGGAGGRVPPSARIFIFSSACVNCAVLCALSFSRAASSGSIELSNIKV